MPKKRTITIKTVPAAINSDLADDQKLIRQLAFLLFTAAGKTGGSFKVSVDAQERYEAGTGDLHILLSEGEQPTNGDVFVTIIRDRDTKGSNAQK